MLIRLATRADVSALERIALKAYRPYVERMGREPFPMRPDFVRHIEADAVFVWDVGTVVAYAIVIQKDGTALLDNIATDPAHQGQKLGAKMITHVELFLREAGFSAYTLYTNIHMTENIGWYTRSGFTETDRRREDGFDRVFFRKEL